MRDLNCFGIFQRKQRDKRDPEFWTKGLASWILDMEELNQRNLKCDCKVASHAVPWTRCLPSLAKTRFVQV